MHTSKTISHTVRTLVTSLSLVLGLTVALNWTVKAQEPAVAAPAGPWLHTDIGSVKGSAGDSQVDLSGVYTVSSAAEDIWGQADSCQFMYQPLEGNVQVVARILGIDGTNAFAKAGVMIRESLEDNSMNAMMLETRGAGAFFQWRQKMSAYSTQTAVSGDVVPWGVTSTAPYWVKVVRWDNWLLGYVSKDGINWTLVGWETGEALPSRMYVGLAVAGHVVDAAERAKENCSATASFDQVSVGPANESDVMLPVVGTGDGLVASYYDNRHLSGTAAVSRVDAEINFDWGNTAPAGLPKPDEFGIRWSGELQAQFTEPYTIYMQADDGVRVWLDENLIIDDWNGLNWAGETSATVNLTAGQRYLIRVEYCQVHGAMHARMLWSTPTTAKQVVPQSQLYSQPTDTDGNGLPDLWEQHYFGHLGVDPNADPDGDGLSNLREYQRHSDPTSPLHFGVPNDWVHGGLGTFEVGSASYNDGVFAVDSTGKDIWDQADSCHFMYQPLNGNGQIVARILGIEGTNEWAKAGVMIRESLDENSKHAMVLETRSEGAFFQWRGSTGGYCDQMPVSGDLVPPGVSGQTAPYWVKVVRSNNWLGGYVSKDGINWTLVAWEAGETLPQQVYVGLAVADHVLDAADRAKQDCSATARFAQVSVGPADLSGVSLPMMGTGDGLMANYYENRQFMSGTATVSRVDPEIDFVWNSAPTGLPTGDNFGISWSGELQAQFTEPYTIYMSADDGARVWLNEDLIIDDWKGLNWAGETSATVNLVAGQRYLIRVEYFQIHGGMHARMRWSSPSTTKQAVPQSQLYSQPTDTDGNGLPDLWEMHYFGHIGVDPNADPDKDGLSNLQEYLHHTNPLNADTDGDGIPDGWEIAHGLNPTYNDAAEDPDQDGLNNLQEYLHGTDPVNADTDGDGLPDGLEVNYLGTDPTVANPDLLTVAYTVNGAQATGILGRWQTDATGIYALDRRGEVEFTLTTTSADKFLLQIEGNQNQQGSLQTAFNLLPSVDGESLGHCILTAGCGTNGVVKCPMPFLTAGTHKVRVLWDDAASISSLRITQLKLLKISAADANRNGVKNWVKRALEAESGLDTNAPLASYTSPVCLEGRDPYLSMMSLGIGAGGANIIPVQHNAGSRWYANVPLSDRAKTNVKISYQNGGKTEKYSLQWLPVNVLASTKPADGLLIRTGDSLLLTARPNSAQNGDLVVTVGTDRLTGRTTQPLAYQFAKAGVYTVTGTYKPKNGETQSGSITVNVVEHSFATPNPSGPVCWMSRQRDWNLSSVPTQVLLEADSRLMAEQMALPNNGVKVTLTIDENEPRYIISRLGDGGPILDSIAAIGFRLFATPDTYNQVIETYPDRTRLVETMEVLSPVLPNVAVHINIIVGGVTFDDGTTEKDLSPTDFDALGQCKLRFLMPEKVVTANCHNITVMQGADCVGHY